MLLRGLSCCGGAEFVGINESSWTAKKYITYYAKQYQLVETPKGGKAFVTISYAWDTNNSGAGHRTSKQGVKRIAALKKLIEDNDLGQLHMMARSSYNPNYDQRVRIRAGIFVPDNQAIAKFVQNKGLVNKVKGWAIPVS